MKKLSTIFCALCLLSIMAFAGSANAATTIKIGHVLNTDHSWHKCLIGFAADVKKETKGRVIVQVYPSGQLGNEKDVVEGLSMQTIDGGLVGGGSFQPIEPKMGIEALPYAWPTHQAAYKAYDGKLGKSLIALLAKKGIIGISWWENGFRNITNNKKPITKPADLKGLKIRVTPDKMRLDTFNALGATPMPIAFGELYSALQQGVVDGEENPYAIIYSNAFYEVQKYLSISNHIWGSALLCVNKTVWGKLSPADQKTFQKLADKWCKKQRAMTIKEEGESLAKLKAKGMKVNKVDTKAFRKAVQPVWAKYESVFGKDTINLVREYGK
jgi:tripartite ATP-independent transporter DctP family solute receptor